MSPSVVMGRRAHPWVPKVCSIIKNALSGVSPWSWPCHPSLVTKSCVYTSWENAVAPGHPGRAQALWPELRPGAELTTRLLPWVCCCRSLARASSTVLSNFPEKKSRALMG